MRRDWGACDRPGSGDHYGAVECLTCGRFLEWLPWPPRSKEEQKRKRSKPLTVLDEDICWYCGITKIHAGLLGLKLERAHTIERARLIDAGLPADDPLNLPLLCSECHSDQHRKREMRARYDKVLGRVDGG